MTIVAITAACAVLLVALVMRDVVIRMLATQERMAEQRSLAELSARVEAAEANAANALAEASVAKRAAQGAQAKAEFAGRRR